MLGSSPPTDRAAARGDAMVTRHASAGGGAQRFSSRCSSCCWSSRCSRQQHRAPIPPDQNPIGIHSMLFLDHPFSAKQAMFKEAAATGASEIRLDIELSGVFPDPNAPPDWSGVDQYMSLARRYHLRVLADLLATPWYHQPAHRDAPASDLPVPTTRRRALGRGGRGDRRSHPRRDQRLRDHQRTRRQLGLSRHAATVRRDPSASYHAIHSANPNARVALGGLMNIGPSGRNWMNAMLTSLGHNATHSFDIANIHVRTTAAQTARSHRLAAVLRRRHFTGPLWVTETGYPADPTQQTDPAYQGGPEAQARYLRRDPDNDPRRRRQGLHHRARLTHRPLRIRRNPPHTTRSPPTRATPAAPASTPSADSPNDNCAQPGHPKTCRSPAMPQRPPPCAEPGQALCAYDRWRRRVRAPQRRPEVTGAPASADGRSSPAPPPTSPAPSSSSTDATRERSPQTQSTTLSTKPASSSSSRCAPQLRPNRAIQP